MRTAAMNWTKDELTGSLFFFLLLILEDYEKLELN